MFLNGADVHTLPLLLVTLLSVLHHALPYPFQPPQPTVFDIRSYGAIGDGKTMNTLPFASVSFFNAWLACRLHALIKFHKSVARPSQPLPRIMWSAATVAPPLFPSRMVFI
jgi:hypothetical protein